ncbi:MAG: sodium-dependent transporter [Bacteroidales bacterium]|jgi:NSS family neurotransmitter:Na+ symporter|nr:sodium-dependent transporter [Bacteroidales bacterium]OQB65489.1 MAG: Sodium:neurotransmitter symporter family protein [Bacteroidetes bacterium ADurb.Bin145]HOU03504.1 sodium-dependent transporter [Bacteroidales bacterium]HQK67627.1 sodium-dependent transporter [Bacteroidales bacterium]
MTNNVKSERDSFSNRFAVVAAVAGSAIGLGNIWRFPYLAGENGGGAFLLVYLFCVVVIGIPVMTSEFIIGRSAQLNPYGAFKKLAPRKPWYLIGIMGVAAAFMILAFYTTVAGWTLEYFYQSLTGNLLGRTDIELTNMFDSFLKSSFRPILWFIVFMGLTAFIIISGVKEGIEKYTKIMMPFLFLILILMCIRSLTLPGGKAGLQFLFHPDMNKITPKVILEALGQSFFSLSIGMGTLITYGSYIRKNENLVLSAGLVSLADTSVAVLAGIAIFPAVFALGGSPASGTGLTFIVLPGIFDKMPLGSVFAFMFFLLLSIAALTSTISVLEVIVAYLVEELKMSRKKATIAASLSVSILGLLTVLSYGALSNLQVGGRNIFGILEFLTSNIMLPIGGLFIVIFIGWFYSKDLTKREFTNEGSLKGTLLPTYIFIVKFVAPVAIAIVFLYSLGIFKLS